MYVDSPKALLHYQSGLILISISTVLCVYYSCANPKLITSSYTQLCPPPQSHPAFDGSGCHAFVCDLTTDQLSDTITRRDVDLASAIFVLSAITPEKMVTALTNIHSVSEWSGFVDAVFRYIQSILVCLSHCKIV